MVAWEHSYSSLMFLEPLTYLLSYRAAMKMANIDAVFDFMFTNPTKENGVRIS